MTVTVEKIQGGWRVMVNGIPMPGMIRGKQAAVDRGERLARQLGTDLEIVENGRSITRNGPSRSNGFR